MPKGGTPVRSKVRWRNVTSSNIDRIGWDDERNMYVMFVSPGLPIYKYEGVSRQRAVAASRAASVGRYLNRVIKPNFPAIRIV